MANMSFGNFILWIFAVFAAVVALAIAYTVWEKNLINEMSPENRAIYVFGPNNLHLICTHCQAKGFVHVKRLAKTVTSKGKVGGILKANTTSTATSMVTQHHCARCTSTWEI